MNDSAPSIPAEAAAFLRECLGEDWTAQPLAGDASVRAYFRILSPDGGTYMLAYYPEEVRPQLARFLAAYEAVAPHGRIPLVLQHSELAVLQRDVGDHTLFDLLHENREEAVPLYERALELLVDFQRAPAAAINPPFTAEFFLNELAMTREFYVERLMGAQHDGELETLLQMLCTKVAQHPYVLCHRDYHGQNIHVVDGTLYVIDYQDLRMGPDTYDAASLLRDRGVARILGDDTERALLEHYRKVCDADEGMRQRYFETLLQRSLKILGTFAKQPLTRGRLHYLDFIPPTLESINRCLDELPELQALRTLFPLQFSLDAARERAERIQHG